mmetsp:Transcript_112633/g.258003  ORF Transcript_112633/g.258003 Transcript_112633/m.258003 type:complete len:204 (+) Transcript_112633:77-688(+)
MQCSHQSSTNHSKTELSSSACVILRKNSQMRWSAWGWSGQSPCPPSYLHRITRPREQSGYALHLSFLLPPSNLVATGSGVSPHPWSAAHTPKVRSIDSYIHPSTVSPPCQGMVASNLSCSSSTEVFPARPASVTSWYLLPTRYPSSGNPNTGATAAKTPGSSWIKWWISMAPLLSPTAKIFVLSMGSVEDKWSISWETKATSS